MLFTQNCTKVGQFRQHFEEFSYSFPAVFRLQNYGLENWLVILNTFVYICFKAISIGKKPIFLWWCPSKESSCIMGTEVELTTLSLTCRWMPESPRWLAARGRTDEADKVLKKIAEQNKTIIPKEMSTKVIAIEKKVAEKTYHLGHLFKTRRLAKITCIEGFSW